MQRTNLLAVYSIQTNMLSATVKEEVCSVMLNSGKTLSIRCPDKRSAGDVCDTLHFYPPIDKDRNNSKTMSFEMEFDVWN
jgi:hypothetical protein